MFECVCVSGVFVSKKSQKIQNYCFHLEQLTTKNNNDNNELITYVYRCKLFSNESSTRIIYIDIIISIIII